MPDDIPRFDDWVKNRSPRERVFGVARSEGVPDDIAEDYLKLTRVESGQNVNVRNSSKGARGFGQVMPDKPGGYVRTVGGRQYDLRDPDQNITAGLRYFAQGGEDPVARRLHYFGGPKAKQHYERTGRIPKISDGNMTAAQYVQATGGQKQTKPPKFDEWSPESNIPKFDDWAKDSGQTPPPTTSKNETRQIRSIPVNPAKAKSAPISPLERALGRMPRQQRQRAREAAEQRPAPGKAGELLRRLGQQRAIDQIQREQENQLSDQVREEIRGRVGPYGNPTGTGVLHLLANPISSFTGLLKSEDEKVAEETAERIKAQRLAETPEVTEIRKEYGAMPAAERSIVAPLARGGAGLLSTAGGIASAFGIAPNRLSEWANKRATIIEAGASNAPLREKRGLSSLITGQTELEEVQRGVPEKIATGIADLGVGLGQIILLQKVTKLPFNQLLALEAAAKNNDKPIEQQLGRAAEGYALGTALQSHLGRGANAALFGIPTAAQTGYEVAQGRMSPLDAAIQTGIQAGAGAILTSPKKGIAERGTQTEAQPPVEAQREAVEPQEAATAAAARQEGVLDNQRTDIKDRFATRGSEDDPLLLGAVQPQRFYHKDFGEVEILPDQTGAGKNRYRVAEVANPDIQHFVKKSALTGRGNERMVPVRPVEAPSRVEPEPAKTSPNEVGAEAVERAPAPLTINEADRPRLIEDPKFKDVLMRESVGGNAGPGRAAVNMAVDAEGRVVAIGNRQDLPAEVRAGLDDGTLRNASAVVKYGDDLDNPQIEKVILSSDRVVAEPTAEPRDITPEWSISRTEDNKWTLRVGGKDVGTFESHGEADRRRAKVIQEAERGVTDVRLGPETIEEVRTKAMSLHEEKKELRRQVPALERFLGTNLPSDVRVMVEENIAKHQSRLAEVENEIGVLSMQLRQMESGGPPERRSPERIPSTIELNKVLHPEGRPGLEATRLPKPVKRQGESQAEFNRRKILAEAESGEGKRVRAAPTHAIGRPKVDSAKNSVSVQARALGGIKPTENFRGEVDRLKLIQGQRGLVNDSSGIDSERMVHMLAEQGYRLPGVEFGTGGKGGFTITDVSAALEAIEMDARGITPLHSTAKEFDFSAAEAEYYAEQEARARAGEARDRFLESGRGAELFDRIVDRKATDAERQEYIDLAEKAGISRAESEDLIADSRAEIESLQGDGREGAQPPTRPAEQLGFVQEGLTQESALPPKPKSLREQLVREEQDRQATLNPERTAAQAKLEEIRRRGMTVEDYARQPDLTGNVPSAEEVARLRDLETSEQASAPDQPKMFGPGTMRAGEPLPEVKEREFGKRFTEDERIADEIRREIGTAKYYEPIPNKVTAAEASKLVEDRGIPESIRIIRDEKNDLPAHVRSAMGQIVIQKLNQTYRNLKAAGSDKAQGVLDQAVDLAEWQMEYGTRLGQGVQSFAMWARLTPEGKLLTYKRAVNKARERHRKLYSEDVAEIVNTVNKEGMTDAERAEALKNLFKTNKTARKVKTDFDKLVRAAKDGKLTDTLFYEIAGEKLGLPSYNPEVASKITALALEIEAAPEGLPRNKLILELQKFIAEQKGFDVADLPLGIFYGNILSGYNTQAVNFVDTGLNVLSEVNGLALNNPRAAAKVYSGMLRGFSEGRFDAISELTKGRMASDAKWMDVPRLMEIAKFGKKGGVPIKTETRVGRLAKQVAESKIAIPLNAYKYVTRAMAASDALMFRAAKEARATLLAYRMAKAEGLTGSALETRVREILALDREGDFQAQARREGFTGNEAQFRAKELREMVRDKDLSADAAEFAGEATYNHTPHGTLGLIAERVGKLSEDVKPLKLFVPFTRIVANVTNRGLNYTPYGYKRAFAGWGFGKNAEALTAEGRRLMLTRATVGTAGMVLLGVMQEAGLITIHGNGPSDREKRRQLQNAGWRPYTLQIGNAYVSYTNTPVGLGLSIIGNMSDAERYHELEQKDAATRGAYAVARLGSTVFSQSFLSGLSRLFGALSEEPGKSVSSVKQFLGGTVSSFGVPNIARDIYRLFDNKAYQSNTLMEDLIRNTPFAAIALKPQLNAFGEPVHLQRQRFFDIQTSDPAWKFVIQKGLRVPVPGRTTEIEKDKRITPEQYYQLLQITGPQIKQWIIDNQATLEPMTENDAQDELQSAATAIRKRALDEMRGKMVKPMKPPAPPKPEMPARP